MKKIICLLFFWRYIIADLLFLLNEKQLILEDLSRYDSIYQHKIMNLNYYLQWNKPFRSIFYYRVKQFRLLSEISKLLIKPLEGIEINTENGKIGGGLKILHNYGCVISCKKAGNNLTVLQGVTIGHGGPNANGQKPVIGNNVIIGANALIIGDISIGDGAVIGGGSVITRDVEENTVVVGNPQRVIRKI